MNPIFFHFNRSDNKLNRGEWGIPHFSAIVIARAALKTPLKIYLYIFHSLIDCITSANTCRNANDHIDIPFNPYRIQYENIWPGEKE